jgi:hypothetical protein
MVGGERCESHVAANVVWNVALPRDELSGGEGEIGHCHQKNVDRC